MSSYPMVDVVSRLHAALPDVPDPHGVVTVKESDLRAVLSQDMLVDSVKAQGAALRSLWDQMDEWQQDRRRENDAHNAAILRRDQRIQELHDQYAQKFWSEVGGRG